MSKCVYIILGHSVFIPVFKAVRHYPLTWGGWMHLKCHNIFLQDQF